MQVSDIAIAAVSADSAADTLAQAATRMWSEQTGSLLVLDGDSLVGIVTERDVMKAVARGLDLATTPISAVMTTTVLTVSPSSSLHDAARHMAERWIRHLPVVDDGKVTGMVSQRSLCGVLAALGDDAQQIGTVSPSEVAERRLRSRPVTDAPA
jgi:signal-transduction protein with cAMP-binding, CBS, and nucleotidyltransferase domain